MKISIIIICFLALSFFAIQAFAFFNKANIETYAYKVVKNFRMFEIRHYESSLFTAVKLPTKEYDQASRKGFSILANYIFGGNNKKEKIAMTSPVAMNLEDSITMMFMVPKAYNLNNLPKPDLSEIELHEEPAKTVAAIRFGGWANSRKIEKYKIKLLDLLKSEGISHIGKFHYLGYNPPFDFINRRNEIIVELERDWNNLAKS